jgi:hypothetical protein
MNHGQIVYWRRDLPPLSEQIEGEHEIEAESSQVHYDFGRRETMWATCYEVLQEQAAERIRQEVLRLGGTCAHVVDEAITAKTNDAEALFSLRGRFRFVMYVHAGTAHAPT